MKKTRNSWIVLGLILLVVTTLVMGWFAGRFVPLNPKPMEEDRVTNLYPNNVDTGVSIMETVNVAAGDSSEIREITGGYQYTYPLGGLLSSTAITEESEGDEELKALKETLRSLPSWRIDTGAFELSVSGVKVLSGESFREWYPNSFIPDKSTLPQYRGSDLPGKAFLVTVKAKNLSAVESVTLPELTLWSDDLNQLSDSLGTGARPSVFMVPVLYPSAIASRYQEGEVSAPNNGEYAAEIAQWRTLAPGEEREIVFPYYVFRNSFVSDEVFENIDLSKFCIEVDDYDPGIRYCFWLEGGR